MREYDIYLPLKTTTGKETPKTFLKKVRTSLLHEFGGVTDFQHVNKGLWKLGTVVFKDDVLIYRVLSRKQKKRTDYLKKLKAKIKRALKQRSVLIVERRINTL